MPVDHAMTLMFKQQSFMISVDRLNFVCIIFFSFCEFQMIPIFSGTSFCESRTCTVSSNVKFSDGIGGWVSCRSECGVLGVCECVFV